ncbi:MAG: fimbrillin family protein [Bacteroidales bacterium]|nr:fimbrillin family protein [Bacteroidales bacterium]
MKRIYIPFLLAFTITACQEGTITPDLATSSEMSFNVLAPGAVTKVTGDVFDAMDEIGLYVTDYVDDATPMPLQISGNRANNLVVSFDGAVWTPERTIYWGAGKSDVYAYYPYMNISDVESQYFEVAADQTGGGYEASDLLWSKTAGVKQTDGAVNLQMNHLMSKLTVKIVAGADYIGSLPDDASILLHSTVTGARVDFTKGSVSKDPYSGMKSIKMKRLGLRSFDGYDAVVYEAIVVPQMLATSVPLLEINSKSVSYLLEDSFNFRPGVAYTYTATLNTSTTAIKVEIGCELEDWNSTGDSGSGDGEGGEDSGDEDDGKAYTDLSAAGTANCYLIQGAGDYKFRSVIGNTDATVGNVKSVEVLWESFGTDEMPNVGDLIASADYKDGYIRFSTPETFRDGNAVIAVKNSKGTILWSWHIWCAEEGWKEQVYYNDAGTMMDRNLGATSATPGDVGALGLLYQWGRKDPFLGRSSISENVEAVSAGTWSTASDGYLADMELNPTTFYLNLFGGTSWNNIKTFHDPCPAGWRVPNGGEEGVWAKACDSSAAYSGIYDSVNEGMNFSGKFGEDEIIWYPAASYRDGHYGSLAYGDIGEYWSVSHENDSYALTFSNVYVNPSKSADTEKSYGRSVRCQKI